MLIQELEIVDLGVAPKGSLDLWGPSFALFSDSVLGEGATGAQAIRHALDEIASMGFDPSLVEAKAKELGYFAQDADTPIGEILEDDEELKEGQCLYYVGIRFQDPSEEDAGNDSEPVEA